MSVTHINPQVNPVEHSACKGEQGFLLVGVIVMVALVLIAISVAAPVIAKDLRREKELEAVHRGQQYTRAIRLYYRKFNSYPSSVKLLEGGTPKERYLRQHYLDPFTGKDDWKLIGVGQAKTTVKGFFGQPLGGLPGAGVGLGAASGMQSTGTGPGTMGGTPPQSGAVGDPSGSSTSGATTTGFGGSSFGQSGSSGGSASPFESGTTGPFVGVGLPKDGPSIITLNEQAEYSKWEFLYDPRIEQLYAKSSIFGGGIASSTGGSGSPPGFGTNSPNNNGPNNSSPNNNSPNNSSPNNNSPNNNAPDNGQANGNGPGGGGGTDPPSGGGTSGGSNPPAAPPQ